MNKEQRMRTESYVYREDRVVSGHKVGERVVHVLPKGTLHDPKGTARARQAAQERVEAMYATPGVIAAPRGQRMDPGWKHPSTFGETPEYREAKELGTVRGPRLPGVRW